MKRWSIFIVLLSMISGLSAQDSTIFTYPTPYDSLSMYDSKAILWKVEVAPPSDLPGKMEEGIWQQMYKDYPEKVRYQWQISKGEKQGHWRAFYVNDSLEAEGFFKNGLSDSTITYYYQEGGIAQQASYIEDVQNGPALTYYLNGNLHTQTNYSSGVKFGPASEYYENGQTKLLTIHADNVAQGPCFGFYETGEIEFSGQYVDGKKDGTFTYYFKNGDVKAINHWKMDEKTGKWIIFRQDGKVFSEEDFSNDQK